MQLQATTVEREDVRNIAIIAHVDHGKTTLTNALMRQCGLKDKEVKSMDSNQIEMERGITILAKNAAVKYNGTKINIIDTPGHADFGGEVERILNMADGVILLVDAQEGPMPQTKFVLRQALKLKLKTIVCINKVDKPASRPDWVLDTTFDLFTALGADDELCDFPVCYASGFHGVASTEGPDKLKEDLKPLLDLIVKECPKPLVPPEEVSPLQMLVANLDYDDYVGRISIGRVRSGSVKVGQKVGFQYGPDGALRTCTISKLWEFNNNERVEAKEIKAGDICAFTGMDDVRIGDTVVDPTNPMPLPPINVEEPTVSMEFGLNTSPLAAQLKESTKLTLPQIKARLEKECLTNLALRMEPGKASDTFKVKGRGTLQLGILIENMRREGFELMIGPPEVLLRKDPETGVTQEPFEEAVVDTPIEFQGLILEEFSKKGAVMQTMEAGAVENTLIFTFLIPTRNLIGMQNKLQTRTKGQAILSSKFDHWGEFDPKSIVKNRDKGSIINVGEGKATAYQILSYKSRGFFFVDPAEEVYPGMIVGVCNTDFDLSLNIAKEKNVTNVREKSADVKVSLPPKMIMTLEDYLGYMDVDEVLEVTPGPIRLSKRATKAKFTPKG